MSDGLNNINTIDQYIEQFSDSTKDKLIALRKLIHEEAPGVVEKMSWKMPTFYLHGNLVHFAVFKKHIGLYPGPDAIESFKQQLTAYKTSKGAVQFPIDQPIPLDLVRDMVRYQVEQSKNMEG